MGAVGLIASLVITGVTSPSRAAEDGLVRRDVMEATLHLGTGQAPRAGDPDPPQAIPPLLVHDDGQSVLGFADGRPLEGGSSRFLAAYDLRSLKEVARIPLDISVDGSALNSAAVDSGRRRIYIAAAPTGAVLGNCLVPSARTDLVYIDYAPVIEGSRTMTEVEVPIPCSGDEPFYPLAIAYDAASDKIYMAGTHTREIPKQVGADLVWDNAGAPLLIRQMDAESFELDWQVDLARAGCGQFQQNNLGPQAFVERIGTNVVSYCWDPKPGVTAVAGRQGYAVRVPLDVAESTDARDWVPVPSGGEGDLATDAEDTALNATIRRTPTLPNQVTLRVDKQRGLLLIITADVVNGNAVWLFDPVGERFLGVLSGGVFEEPTGNLIAGFNAKSGRVYLLTADGILVAPVRETPLRAPLATGKVANKDRVRYFADIVNGGNSIAVAPTLRRVFVPVHDEDGYVVLEDNIPAAASSDGSDVDAGTEGIPEEPGKTEVVRAGEGAASGAHYVITGGVNRFVDQLDPFCEDPFKGFPPNPNGQLFGSEEEHLGQCASAFFFTPGHREAFLAESEVGVGFNAGGSVADAAGLRFPPTDTATNKDFENFNENGTKGPSGCGEPGNPPCQGYPVPASHCGDFGGNPSSDSLDEAPAGMPQSAFFASSVQCAAQRFEARAESAAAGFAFRNPAESAVSVGRVRSNVESFASKSDGQVTIAEARADNVIIGPVRIAEVRALALTKAQGQEGSTEATFIRRWCGVEFDGFSSGEGCIDPADRDSADFIDRMNQALARVQLRITPSFIQASNGGYLAVVKRDEGFIASDRSIANDQSQTISGLHLTFFNDSHRGRSRFILKLANVRTETRYGVRSIPQFDVPQFTFSAPTGPVSLGDEVLATPGVAAVSAGSRGEPERFVTIPATDVRPKPENRSPIQQLIDLLPGFLEEGLRLLVNEPWQFLRLFVLWGLLFAGPHLLMRRRRLAGELGGAGA